MNSILSSTNKISDQEVQAETTITSQLSLKTTHTSESLDKDVVLSRIRYRKRVNMVHNAFQSLLSSPFSPKAANKASLPESGQKWWEDAFGSP
ncbi:hypothetical protein ACHQM5_023340 [Ranunculus cassubicifolius]